MRVGGRAWGASLSALLIGGAAHAAPTTYVYAVEHPTYGNIGSFTETIDKDRDSTRINSELQVAVKFMGIVVHREYSSAAELWRGARLAAMQAVTRINGTEMDVSGAADSNEFVVTSAKGTQTAPADVAPSDPWMLRGIGQGVIVSTRSGKIEAVTVTGGEPDALTRDGVALATRHFRVDTPDQPDRFDIWLDPGNVPVKFRTRERSGDLIDFVLVSSSQPQGTVAGALGLALPQIAHRAGG